MNHPGDAAAALKGASLAFHKRKPSAPPSPHRSDNGALTAATLSAHSTGGSATGLPDVDSAASRNMVAARLQQHQQHQQFLQPPPSSGGRVDPKSPSFIAATLAASRSASPSPKARTPRRRVSVGGTSTVSAGEVVDSGSIAPTGSLISMFEGDSTRTGRSLSPARAARSKPVKQVTQPRSLTPPPNPVEVPARPVELPKKPKKEDLPAPSTATGEPSRKPVVEIRTCQDQLPQKPKYMTVSSPATGELSRKPGKPPKPAVLPNPPPETPVRRNSKEQKPKTPDVETKKPSKPAKPPLNPLSSPPQPVVSRAQTEVLSPKPTRVTKPQLPPPPPPQYQRTISRPAPQSSYHHSPGDPQKRHTPSSQPKPLPKQAPAPPRSRGSNRVTGTPTNASRNDPPRPKTTEADRTKTGETTSTNEEFVSAPTSPEQSSPRLPARRQDTASPFAPPPTRTTHTRKLSHTQSSQNLGLSSLTSAIMAGSLASSRLTPSNTGTSLPPQSLPQRQKSPRLRQTMRTPAHASDDEEDRHRKGHHRHKLRSGKHAHHEGSRKKWRDEIRPRERKRYEAVWASNRGALLPASQPAGSVSASSSKSQPIDYANSVANVIVRDIWRRSRLPEDELVEVWDLVDREKRGLLGRQEFVVGMWLIDQRLRGRKIPTKVSNSVWGSANGVQVQGPKMR